MSNRSNAQLADYRYLGPVASLIDFVDYDLDFHRLSIKQKPSRGGLGIKKKRDQKTGPAYINPGDDLLSPAVAHAVPSALEGLTAVFGMGTGVTPPVRSPGNFLLIRNWKSVVAARSCRTQRGAFATAPLLSRL